MPSSRSTIQQLSMPFSTILLLGLLLFSVCKVHAFSCTNRNGMDNKNILLPSSLKNIERMMKSSTTTTTMMTKQPSSVAQNDRSKINRRGLLQKTIKMMSVLTTTMLTPSIVLAEEGQEQQFTYDLRDRNKNKDAIIRDDIWYFTGQNPPRKLDLSNLPPGPKYNAWGSCVTDASTGNSCTYVSLKQRIPAYSQYAFSISLGAKDFNELGTKLNSIQQKLNTDGNSVESEDLQSLLGYIEIIDENNKYLPPAPDALLKMVLLATAMLTSPNYTGPPFELLIARYYINEVDFAMKEIGKALKANDVRRANAAWRFGADSWNSYFTIVNNAIVPKVGEKFVLFD